MPLVFEKIFENDFSILGVWKIDENVDELLEFLMMKSSEMNVLQSFKNDTRKIQWLSVRALIRTLLNNPSFPLEVIYDKFNKPTLVQSKYNVSISHSRNKAAVILSKSNQLGVDIEHIHPKIERVIHKFMSDTEINAAPKGFEIEYYHICWCAKEALYKLNGRSGINFIEDIKISSFPYKEKGEFNAEINIKNSWNLFKMYYFKVNDYMLVYVTGN